METEKRWERVLHAKLLGVTADQAWSLLKDFCGIHKLFPGMVTCTRVDGADGLPGCIRHCIAEPMLLDGGQPFVPWVKERLLSVDPAGWSYSYEETESNMGFRRYTATMKAKSEDEDGSSSGGCRVELSFVADPVEGWTEEGLVSYLQNAVEGIGKRIEEAVQPV